MPRMIGSGLSRREREILEILHRAGKATAIEVMEAMPDPPSYAAVRSLLRVLEEKGHVRHEMDGKRFLYQPTEPPQTAARNALRNVVQNFFGGSMESAIKTFLSDADVSLSEEELTRMTEVIEQARKPEGA